MRPSSASPAAVTAPIRPALSAQSLEDRHFYHRFLTAAIPTLPLRSGHLWAQAATMSHSVRPIRLPTAPDRTRTPTYKHSIVQLPRTCDPSPGRLARLTQRRRTRGHSGASPPRRCNKTVQRANRGRADHDGGCGRVVCCDRLSPFANYSFAGRNCRVHDSDEGRRLRGQHGHAQIPYLDIPHIHP